MRNCVRGDYWYGTSTPFTDSMVWKWGNYRGRAGGFIVRDRPDVLAPCDADALAYHRQDECQYALDWYFVHVLERRCTDMQCENGRRMQMDPVGWWLYRDPVCDGCF